MTIEMGEPLERKPEGLFVGIPQGGAILITWVRDSNRCLAFEGSTFAGGLKQALHDLFVVAVCRPKKASQAVEA